MTDIMMAAWWAELTEEERTAILLDWPYTGELSTENLALLPAERRAAGTWRPGRWVWLEPEPGDDAATAQIVYSDDFARFLHSMVQAQFQTSTASSRACW